MIHVVYNYYGILSIIEIGNGSLVFFNYYLRRRKQMLLQLRLFGQIVFNILFRLQMKVKF